MSPDHNALAPVLVVDDDTAVLGAMGHLLRGKVNATLESNSMRARDLLESRSDFAVLISDLRMPGIDGLALLHAARRLSPDTVRILISGTAELGDTVAAVNECQVFRMLLKPFDMQVLIDAVLAACEQHRLVTAERVLLEETLQGSVQALAELFLLVQPAGFGRAMRLRRHVSDLARHLDIAPRWDIEIAALVSQIGSVTMSDETLDRWYHGRPLSPEESEEVQRLPQTAQSLIANIPRLEGVQAILRLQNAPAGAHVPPGARLLAIARDFDGYIAQGLTADQALDLMDSRVGRYDATYLAAFRDLRGSNAPSADIREMRLSEVTEAMVLASDVHSPSGTLLVARGQRVTPALMQRIHGQWDDFAVEHMVRVIVPN
jgi:response regulator RpfG family c-di-GMP phosphodiesterase